MVLQRIIDLSLIRPSLLSLATRIRPLVSAHGTCPIAFVLWMVKQSKIGFAEDSWAPRINLGYLVKVLLNVSVARLGRPLDLGLTIPV
jgi:hypothetical protein